jgi:hypothetical protein
MSNAKIRIIAKEVELIRDEDGKVVSVISNHITRDFNTTIPLGNPLKDYGNKRYEIVSAEILED